MRAFEVVLFDLDGTLVDSAPDMLASLRHAFAEFGQPPLDEATARSNFGPPIRDWLPPIVGDPVVATGIIASYRAHYAAGGSAATEVFGGIEAVLTGLRHRGTIIAVATSKVEGSATEIVERTGLSRFMTTVTGDTADGTRGTKALVVAEALRRLGGPDPSGVLMVGDREHDVFGARANGLPCAGAAWGYGGAAELAAAGADPICASPAELGAHLGLADAAAS